MNEQETVTDTTQGCDAADARTAVRSNRPLLPNPSISRRTSSKSDLGPVFTLITAIVVLFVSVVSYPLVYERLVYNMHAARSHGPFVIPDPLTYEERSYVETTALYHAVNLGILAGTPVVAIGFICWACSSGRITRMFRRRHHRAGHR